MARDAVPGTLIYNPNAGSSSAVAPDALIEMLESAGYCPVHRETESPEELDRVFADTEGLIFVAGGDGTFREVAKRMQGRHRPLALLPLGTANNTARTLGVEGTLKQVIAGLRQPHKKRIDLVRTRGKWGEEWAVEGAGLGMFANVLAAYKPDEGKSLVRALGAAANELNNERAARCIVEVDGSRFEGEFLLIEAMNMRAIGPRLNLAPEADPSDGLLDIVLVSSEKREAFIAYLRRVLTGNLSNLPSVEVLRGKSMRVNWRGAAFHVDALSLCDEARESGTKGYSAQVEVVPEALEVWLPERQKGR